jgi:hypothetical protein
VRIALELNPYLPRGCRTVLCHTGSLIRGNFMYHRASTRWWGLLLLEKRWGVGELPWKVWRVLCV